MNIKNRGNRSAIEFSSVSSASTFQKQIELLQTQIQECKRSLDLFDIYHFRYGVSDMDNYEAVKNKLLPGESLVIIDDGNDEHPNGQVTVRLSDLEYLSLEPFQTGTYFPSKIETVTTTSGTTNNYKLSYSFTDKKAPATGPAVTLSSNPIDRPAKELIVNLAVPTTTYYYSFNDSTGTSTEDVSGIVNPHFCKKLNKPESGDLTIDFVKKPTKPIIKFFIYIEAEKAFEECYLDYQLKSSSTDNSKYNIVIKPENIPHSAYVAIK